MEERIEIANSFLHNASRILDAGCGRGYFAFACAHLARHVVGVDIMNGELRRGWWQAFISSRRALRLEQHVQGARADARTLPFRSASFDVVASVHALRNMGSKSEIKPMLREMKRVLKPGGRALLVESVMESGEQAQDVYVQWYRLRTRLGWELQLPPPSELESWFEETKFSSISSEVRNFGLHYAPVAFRLPTDTSPNESGTLAAEYDMVRKRWETWGEKSPQSSSL